MNFMDAKADKIGTATLVRVKPNRRNGMPTTQSTFVARKINFSRVKQAVERARQATDALSLKFDEVGWGKPVKQ